MSDVTNAKKFVIQSSTTGIIKFSINVVKEIIHRIKNARMKHDVSIAKETMHQMMCKQGTKRNFIHRSQEANGYF